MANTNSKRPVSELLAMTESERNALTWEEAAEFIPEGLLERAEWDACRNASETPISALLKVRTVMHAMHEMEVEEKKREERASAATPEWSGDN